jgi:N-acetylglucosaminyldiphosphoundecaprenol N-acetyl-beta-D-mannosaminyltransferase
VSGASPPLLGYRLTPGDPEPCLSSIAAWIEHGDRNRWLACLNPHSYVVALDDPAFAAALRAADWLIPDGAGIVLASHLLGAGLGPRLTGSDIFDRVSRRLDERGGASVFFLGGLESTLAAIRVRHARDFPRLRVAGTLAPPVRAAFSEAELDEMVRAIEKARPDVLWVGLGAPKQELLLHLLSSRIQVRFAAAVGAVFDFYAGRVRRSHAAFQRAGLEWLPRLVQEPRRLWRRNLRSSPVFLWHVARARLGLGARPPARPGAEP